MKFPARERVLYDPNPLGHVSCTFSFPRNLAIDNELPVSFQQALKDFPFLETEGSDGIASDRQDESSPRSMIYEFHSADRNVSIALGSSFLGIRTKDYDRWEHFREHITTAVRTLLQ